jgi:hypothetical protein
MEIFQITCMLMGMISKKEREREENDGYASGSR